MTHTHTRKHTHTHTHTYKSSVKYSHDPEESEVQKNRSIKISFLTEKLHPHTPQAKL